MVLAETSVTHVKRSKAHGTTRTARKSVFLPSSQPVIGLCCLLVAITWFVFGPTLHHGFVNYDDPGYVYENSAVTPGLTMAGAAWAFTHSHARNWHPLTTISHMLDCHLFGLQAKGHHATSVFLHTAAVLLLFLLLREMTGGLWRSAFVAALFAIHPLRVESVAWISERKDVLSGIFFVLTLGAYLRYIRSPSAGRYSMVMLMFLLGLMSKPMLVTVPFVLLLLDYWPLRRAQPAFGKTTRGSSDRAIKPARFGSLLLEKLPLIALSAASSMVTFIVQKTGGSLSDPLPLTLRIGNALTAYIMYIWQFVWPAKLAPFYPRLEELPVWQLAFALTLLLAMTMLAWRRRDRNPYMVTGWFWYLGMLLPVIGIVQVGAQGWADRYTYLPHIGLYLCLVWAIADLSVRWAHRQAILTTGGIIIIVALAWTARVQTSYWRDSETLWIHTLAVTSESSVVHNNYGQALSKRGKIEEALRHYEKALEIRSHQRTSRYDFLLALTHVNLGGVLRKKGQLDEAIEHYRQATALQPDYAESYLSLGDALTEKGQLDDAIAMFEKALAVQPSSAAAYVSLGTAFLKKGQDAEAVARYEKALELAPHALTALNNLAWLYATSPNPSIRNGARATVLARDAVRISGGRDPFYLHKLAAGYAATGDYPKALETAQQAFRLATVQQNSALADELQRNMTVYRTNNPVVDNRR